MFGDFLRQKETSIPNDLTRMVSLRQCQTRRRIESNSIFEHTRYSKSKGINKSLLLRTTLVSSGGGGGEGGREGGVHSGPCQKPEDRKLFIRTKTGQQKDFEGSNRRIKVKDRQPGGAKKTKEKKVGWPTIFAMFILVEWLAVFLSFFPWIEYICSSMSAIYNTITNL